MRSISRPFLLTISLLGLFSEELTAIATISTQISSPFGTYEPKSVPFTAKVPQYNVPDDLAGVLYADSYTFSDSAKAMLVRNGFVAVPAEAQSFTAIYKATNDKRLPVFLTVDAVLHTFYKSYDYMLRIAEYKKFYYQLDSMLSSMLDAVKPLLSTSGNDSLRLAVKRAAALLDVAYTLLTDIMTFTGDPEIKAMVAAETSLVRQHKGFAPSAVLPELKEDFTQYIPRGHYTLDEKFERYFRSMMYLGRMNLYYLSRIETMTACILTRLWATAKKGAARVSDVWAAIYNPTAFFVGYSDDFTFSDYADVLERITGSSWRTGDIGIFYARLPEIMTELQKLPQPRILSGLSMRPGLRIMGQRFVPDSYAFGQLVYDHVGAVDNWRLFPRGLDVMAVLGSQHARQYLIDFYHEDQYLNYTSQLDSLTRWFASLPDAQWIESLYWNWLYALVPLLEIPGKGYPFFMTTQAWADKSITSALGSWAELRHASILYVKESYTATGIPCPHAMCFPQGYVEPSPEAFARIAAMAAYMKNGLNRVGLSSNILPLDKLTTLENLCITLRDIAVRELENSSLTIQQYIAIADAYKNLDAIEDFRQFQVPPLPSDRVPIDTSTAIIADVHTDPNTGYVLEVGVGKPMCLYVVVPVEGKLQVCRGAMFSYYEFRQPMDNRLTDAQWQTMLASSKPSMPEWTAGFTSSKGNETFRIPLEDLTVVIDAGDSISETVRPGDSLIAILHSDTIPAISVESAGWFEGTPVATSTYRVAIPPSALSDTTILTVNSRYKWKPSGNIDPYCILSAPPVQISYRKVVYRDNNTATLNSDARVNSLSQPRFHAGSLIVPSGTTWRIVDPCGRLVARLGPETAKWVPAGHTSSNLLLLLPEKGKGWKFTSLSTSR